MISLAYRCGPAIAINISRGVWHVFDLRGYDPVKQTFNELRAYQTPRLASNRRAAIKLVKEKL